MGARLTRRPADWLTGRHEVRQVGREAGRQADRRAGRQAGKHVCHGCACRSGGGEDIC